MLYWARAIHNLCLLAAHSSYHTPWILTFNGWLMHPPAYTYNSALHLNFIWGVSLETYTLYYRGDTPDTVWAAFKLCFKQMNEAKKERWPDGFWLYNCIWSLFKVVCHCWISIRKDKGRGVNCCLCFCQFVWWMMRGTCVLLKEHYMLNATLVHHAWRHTTRFQI